MTLFSNQTWRQKKNQFFPIPPSEMPLDVFRQHTFADFLPCRHIPRPNYDIFRPAGSSTEDTVERRRRRRKK